MKTLILHLEHFSRPQRGGDSWGVTQICSHVAENNLKWGYGIEKTDTAVFYIEDKRKEHLLLPSIIDSLLSPKKPDPSRLHATSPLASLFLPPLAWPSLPPASPPLSLSTTNHHVLKWWDYSFPGEFHVTWAWTPPSPLPKFPSAWWPRPFTGYTE